MRTDRWLLIYFCLLVVSTLSGCENKKSILLDDTLCQAPCWQNIYPGKTTFSETVEILSRATYINAKGASPTPAHIVENYGYSSWTFIENVREMGITVYSIDNSVGLLQFDTNRNVSIDEMLVFYGEPELILVVSGMSDSRWLNVFWIYPSKGVILELFDSWWKPEGNMVEITPKMKVSDVYYFDPNAYETLLKREILLSPYDLELVQKSIIPWKGYGSVPYSIE